MTDCGEARAMACPQPTACHGGNLNMPTCFWRWKPNYISQKSLVVGTPKPIDSEQTPFNNPQHTFALASCDGTITAAHRAAPASIHPPAAKLSQCGV